jgi:hypothetical protein
MDRFRKALEMTRGKLKSTLEIARGYLELETALSAARAQGATPSDMLVILISSPGCGFCRYYCCGHGGGLPNRSKASPCPVGDVINEETPCGAFSGACDAVEDYYRSTGRLTWTHIADLCSYGLDLLDATEESRA